MVHGNKVVDTGGVVFEIDTNTRRIIKPKKIPKLVQFDHNSERLTFSMQRFIEGHDIAECNITEVHYTNIDVQTLKENDGVYEIDDLQVDDKSEEKVMFSWLISDNATQYSGELNFSIRLVCAEDDGTINYAWDTTDFDGLLVLPRRNNFKKILKRFPDTLVKFKLEVTQMLTEMCDSLTAGIRGMIEYLSTTLSAEIKNTENHIKNEGVHVTTTDKAAWNDKYTKNEVDTRQLQLSQYVDSSINEANKNIYAHQQNSTIHVTTEDKKIWSDKYTKKESDTKILAVSKEVNDLLQNTDTNIDKLTKDIETHKANEVVHIDLDEKIKLGAIPNPETIATVDENGKLQISQLPLGVAPNTAYPGNNGKKNADAIESLQSRVTTDEEDISANAQNIQSLMSKATQRDQAIANNAKSIQINTDAIANFETRSITDTVLDSLISVSDSAKAPIKSMKIFGKTTQFTTTGKNKLPYPYYNHSITKNGITFTDNGDGSITLNGTATSNANFFLATSGNFLEAGKTYCIVTKMPNVTTTMVYQDENGQTQSIGDNKETSVVWSENYTLGNIFIYVAKGTTANNTVYPIIVEGTSYDGIWEPYTGGIPSPNPNYPQELVSVGDGGSTTEYVMGGNLFNNDTSLLKKVTYTGTQGGQSTRIGYEPIVLPAGTYTFTLTDLDTSLSKYVYGCINDKDDKFVRMCNLLQSTNNHTPLTITVNEGDKIYIYDGQTFLDITERSKTFKAVQIQLEAGDKATPYEPYKSQSLTIPTPNGLNALPVSDAGVQFNYDTYTDNNGQSWRCDEVDFKRKVYTQRLYRFKVTNLDVTSVQEFDGCYFVNVALPKTSLPPSAFLSKDFFSDRYSVVINPKETGVIWDLENITIADTRFTDVDTANSILAEEQPEFIYALAEPIETPLTEEEIQAYKALHTNYPNTTIYNSDGAGTEVEYVADTKLYVDNKIASEVEKLTAAIIAE